MFHLKKKPEEPARSQVIPLYKGPRCPFYGFVSRGNFFMETEDGTCVLTSEQGLCRMERAGDVPGWDRCSVFNHERDAPMIARLLDSIAVAPEVFWPKGAQSWAGMKFRDWFEHVMGRPGP